MKRILELSVWWANILLVLLTLIAYFAPYVNPSHAGGIAIIGLGYPALLFCNILVIIYWLLHNSKKWILSCLVLLVGYQSCNRLITFNLTDSSADNKTQLNVASYNINFSKPIALAPLESQTLLESEFNNYLQSLESIDVLAVQEHGWRSKEYLGAALNFPFIHDDENMTVAIYSRHPFISTGQVDFNSNMANTCLWADIAVAEDTIRVYTAHLESNRHDGQVPKLVHQEAPEAMSNSALLGIVMHYQKFTTERAKQAELIQLHRRSAPYASIICSDMNDTPQTFVYKVMRNDMQDSFEEEGFGLGSTFGKKIPALRIDHILVDEAFEVLDHKISRSKYSDHYIQIARLEI